MSFLSLSPAWIHKILHKFTPFIMPPKKRKKPKAPPLPPNLDPTDHVYYLPKPGEAQPLGTTSTFYQQENPDPLLPFSSHPRHYYTYAQPRLGRNKAKFHIGPYGHSAPSGHVTRRRERRPATDFYSSKSFHSKSKAKQSLATPLWDREAIAIDEETQAEAASDERHTQILGDTLFKQFTFVRWTLMLAGQYPFRHVRSEGFWQIGWFNFRWNMIWFKILGVGMIAGFLSLIVGTTSIMMVGRSHPKSMTDGQILRQALLERHTQFMLHMILYLGLASAWFCLLLYRKKLWLRVLNGIWHFTWETGVDFTKSNNREAVPFSVFLLLTLILLVTVSLCYPSPQAVGCPTVLIFTMFHFLIPDKTLNLEYPGSELYSKVTAGGSVLIIFIIFIAHVPLLLYCWCMAVIKSAWNYWNGRMHFHLCRGEETASDRDRTSYEYMFWDVNRLLDLTCDMDELWSLIFEAYLFVVMLLLSFENGFAAKVAQEGDRPLTQADWGQRFIRPGDWRSSVVLAPLNVAVLTVLMFCPCWATDAAGGGYDIMRRKGFIDGLTTNAQVYFTTGLIQMYSVLRTIGFEFGRYVDVTRSNFLVLCNLVISTSILVWQLNLQNDMLTLNYPKAHDLMGKFCVKLEGVKHNHTVMTDGN